MKVLKTFPSVQTVVGTTWSVHEFGEALKKGAKAKGREGHGPAWAPGVRPTRRGRPTSLPESVIVDGGIITFKKFFSFENEDGV
jgi:hypothetical protein